MKSFASVVGLAVDILTASEAQSAPSMLRFICLLNLMSSLAVTNSATSCCLTKSGQLAVRRTMLTF